MVHGMERLFKYACGIFFCILCFNGNAQETSATTIKKYKFTVYAGLGPNFYFNNLVLAKDYVGEFNYQFVARFMWEPEHLLSLGFETGYNRLYHIKENPSTTSEVKISNALVPLQLVISMKFLKQFYGNFTMGQSILLNNVTAANNGNSQQTSASNVSLGDFGLAVGYRKSFNTRFYLGSEFKGYYSSKLNDKNIGLVFMSGYRF
jgi:hypothetical protein